MTSFCETAPRITAATVCSIARLNGFVVENNSATDAGGGKPSTDVPMQSEAASCIARLVDFRLRQVVQEARKFLLHSCTRTPADKLTCRDIQNAMKILRIEPLWGAITSRSSLKRPRTVGSSVSASVVDTAQFASLPFLPVPSDPILSIHWLAVEGHVPRISQNVSEGFAPGVDYSFDDDCDPVVESSTYRQQRQDVAKRRYQRNANHQKTAANRFGVLLSNDQFVGSGGGDEDDSFVPLTDVLQVERVEHRLSKEHRMFLSQIRGVIRSALVEHGKQHSEAVSNVLTCLQTDPGSAQLVPYMTHFAASEIRKALQAREANQISSLRLLTRFLSALIENQSLRLEHYMHQILHPLLSIVLSPLLGGASVAAMRSSLPLRRLAAETVSDATFNSKVTSTSTLRRVSSLYRRHLQDFMTPLPSMFGAVVGVRALGPAAIQLIIFPILPLLVTALESTEHLEAVAVSTSQMSEKEENDNISQDKRQEIRTLIIRELLGSIGEGIEPWRSGSSFFQLTTLTANMQEVHRNVERAVAQLVEMSSERHLPALAAAAHQSRLQSRTPPDDSLAAAELTELRDASITTTDFRKRRAELVSAAENSFKRIKMLSSNGSLEEVPKSQTLDLSNTIVGTEILSTSI